VVRADAATALSALGSSALLAVPALFESFKSASFYPNAQNAVLETLRRLPFEPREADPVLDDLRRQNRHFEAMEIVRHLSLHTP